MTSAGAFDGTGRHGTKTGSRKIFSSWTRNLFSPRDSPAKMSPGIPRLTNLGTCPVINSRFYNFKSRFPSQISHHSGPGLRSRRLCPGCRPLVDGRFQRFLKKAFIWPKNVRKIKIKKIIAFVQLSSIRNNGLCLRAFFKMVDCIFNILKLIKIWFVPSLIIEKSRCSICKHMTNIKLIWIKQ